MTNTSHDTTEGALRADISAPVGPADTYDIAPADRPYLERLAGMDPFADEPSPHEYPNHWAPKVEVSMEMLSPEMRASVSQKMANVPLDQHAALEPQFIMDALKARQAEVRIQGGLSKDATPYHREMLSVLAEYREQEREFDRISEALSEVATYRHERDPQTGELKAIPVYMVEGARRKAFADEQAAVLGRMRCLIGEDGTHAPEARERIRRARWETVQAWKAHDAQLAERAEAKQMALDLARKERIETQAHALKRVAANTF